jgi:hypothetical protein
MFALWRPRAALSIARATRRLYGRFVIELTVLMDGRRLA